MRIRSDQLDALRERRNGVFLEEMLDYARPRHPGIFDHLDDEAAARLIAAEVGDARALGFVLRGHVKRYLDLAFVAGPPLRSIYWAAAVAEDRTTQPAARLHRLERIAAFTVRPPVGAGS